jgi:Methyltransferase domain
MSKLSGDSVLRRTFLRASTNARAKRGRLFREYMSPSSADRILDLGSEDGSHIASIIPFRDNVWIADIDTDALRAGSEAFGFRTVQLQEDGQLPFPDRYFDIVFCSSVLEHVTIAKRDVRGLASGREFRGAAYAHQQEFAREIARIGRRYFVQTPYRYFPIESHTWLPGLIVFLPRAALLRLIAWTNRVWVKSTEADWHLLTQKQMRALFPDAEIVVERTLGLPKSLIAIRSEPETLAGH